MAATGSHSESSGGAVGAGRKSFVAALVVSLAIAGCAGTRARVCSSFAGADGRPLEQPPANAVELLHAAGDPRGTRSWLAQGSDRLLLCVVPYVARDCDSAAYRFVRVDGKWQFEAARTSVVVCEE